MAENVCSVCRDTFKTMSGKPPSPPICDDCALEQTWGVRLDGDVGADITPMPPPPPPKKPAKRKRAA